MPYLVAFIGLVGLLQGIVWISAANRDDAPAPRTTSQGRIGMLLAPLGLLLFAGGVLVGLLPGFLD